MEEKEARRGKNALKERIRIGILMELHDNKYFKDYEYEEIIEYLRRSFPGKLPLVKVGEIIGSGAEGIVFEFEKVAIKICLRPHNKERNIEEVVKYIRDHKHRHICKIYHFEWLNRSLGQYWYVMERLEPITEDEIEGQWYKRHFAWLHKKIFDETWVYCPRSWIGRQSLGLVEALQELKLIHWDWQDFNVMQGDGVWKFIDIESFGLLKGYNHEKVD